MSRKQEQKPVLIAACRDSRCQLEPFTFSSFERALLWLYSTGRASPANLNEEELREVAAANTEAVRKGEPMFVKRHGFYWMFQLSPDETRKQRGL